MRAQSTSTRPYRGLPALLALVLFACVLALVGCSAMATPDFEVSDESTAEFGTLLCDLADASKSPSSQSDERIDADLETIRSIDARDGEVADAIAACWRHAYLDPSYELCLHGGGPTAPELEDSQIADDGTHAFVVLGYELENGEMQDELKGRCEAAAAAARSFPNSILVCTGGATGENNPNGHTEAGLMKSYLVDKCGIEAARIHTDETAMTTAENAQNTYDILREQNIKAMTIVTSSYHQRWAQVVYGAMGALCQQRYAQNVSMVGDYSYDVEPSVELYKQDVAIAALQIAQILDLPQEVVETLPEIHA